MKRFIIREAQLKEYVEKKKTEKIFYEIIECLYKNKKYLNENISMEKVNNSMFENFKRKKLLTPRVNEMLIKYKILNENNEKIKKRIFLIHGWDGSPNEPMHKWIKKVLEAKKFEVFVPNMPNPEKPKINSWIKKINDIVEPLNNNDIFIGHSIGAQAILRYVEKLNNNIKINKIILIAPWIFLDKNTVKEEGDDIKKIAKPWMETPIDFTKIKSLCDNITAIFSTNDSYVPLANSKIFEKKLDAKILILKNMGHFDSSNKINKLPELINIIDKKQ